ncbi:MAG: TatD family hydrolase [Alphaproteobacteria bacterium]
MRLVDSHCHLDMLEEATRRDVVERAIRAGVRGMLTICTSLSAVDTVAAIAAEFSPNVAMAVGVHPHRVGTEGIPEEGRLTELGLRSDVMGLGETGLDYFYDKSPREEQQESFRRHIRASHASGVPFIVHTRDADDDTIRILDEEAGPNGHAGLLHCFSSGRALAERALEHGMYVSLSGILTFNNAEDIRAIATDVPLDRLLVETDAPFLAPVPMRGKQNEPAYTLHTARKLAEVKGVSEDEIAAATTANFARLFTKAQGLVTA